MKCVIAKYKWFLKYYFSKTFIISILWFNKLKIENSKSYVLAIKWSVTLETFSSILKNWIYIVPITI